MSIEYPPSDGSIAAGYGAPVSGSIEAWEGVCVGLWADVAVSSYGREG